MPLAILIGFEYTFNTLTSNIIDLYQAYKWCHSFGCEIHLITDVFHDLKSTPHIIDAVNNQILPDSIYDFYDLISNKYITTTNVGLVTTVLNIYKSYNGNDNRIVFYYSGHGIKDCLVMPDKGLLPCVDLRDNFLQILPEETEILWILDCCNPHGMYLPYSYIKNDYVLNTGKIDFVPQSIILLTSASNTQKSIATTSGSVFSQNLFQLLYTPDLDLNTIITQMHQTIKYANTGYDQTVSIYTSYINNHKLWSWIGRKYRFPHIYDSISK